MSSRKVFTREDGAICSAAGIIPYTEIEGVRYFMMQYNYSKHWYEDFGGKVDKFDSDIFETAVRETVEETNASVFTGKSETKDDYLATRINEFYNYYLNYNSEKTFVIYDKSCKYTFFLYYQKPTIFMKHLLPNRFGPVEFQENKKRDIVCVTHQKLNELIKRKRTNPRLKKFL